MYIRRYILYLVFLVTARNYFGVIWREKALEDLPTVTAFSFPNLIS